jgi:hypothetical protein
VVEEADSEAVVLAVDSAVAAHLEVVQEVSFDINYNKVKA